MRSQLLSRRRIIIVQAALAILALLVVALFSGNLSAQHSLVLSGSTAEQNLRANLSSLIGVDAARVSSAAEAVQITSPAQAYEALNRRAGGTLQVTWDSTTNIPRFLTGNSATAPIPYVPTAAELGNPKAIALGFLDENRALFRLDAASKDFGPARIDADMQLNYSNVRLPQMYNGVPVYGRQLLVHLDASGQIMAVNGDYLPNLAISTQPAISAVDAERLALQDVKANELKPAEASTVRFNVLTDKTALNVYIDDKGMATLTWNVQMTSDSPTGEWTVFVNARRPAVVHVIDTLANAKDRKTYTARKGTDIPGQLLIQEGETSKDAIAQAAHDNAGKVYDYYMNTFKRDSIDGRGMTIASTVHYGTDPQDAENAAWLDDAQQMIYGDGGKEFKPLAYGLDVVGHELTHGVTFTTANLNYEAQSGALNESYSDVFGAMIDRTNWTIGEAVIKSPPFPVPYLRSMQDPHMGNNYDPSDPLSSVGQPATMNEYADLPNTRDSDNGGVHVNSGIPNHIAYLIGTALGKDKLEQIYYRTLTQYLTPDSQFSDAARASVRAATELYGASAATSVQNAFSQAGISTTGDSGPTPPPSPSSNPTQGPTNPQPTQTVPTGCRETIVNGGFESSQGWHEASASNVSIIDPQLPHTGSQSAWLGGIDNESLQYIYQDVSIPSNATSVKLTYYRLIHKETSGLSGLLASDATFTVLIADTQGNKIAAIETLSSSQGDDKWKQVQFDLARYAGQTVRLVFTASNPRGNISSLFVDDVSMIACTTGTAPQAPSTSGDNVYLAGHILDADTNRGISGAQLFVMKPGLTATQAAQDGQITDDEVLTYGISDSKGYYQTQDPLAKNQTYSVIVIADGYQPIVADNGLTISNSDPNPTVADATMRAGQ